MAAAEAGCAAGKRPFPTSVLTDAGSSRFERQHAAAKAGDGCRDEGTDLKPLLAVDSACRRGEKGSEQSALQPGTANDIRSTGAKHLMPSAAGTVVCLTCVLPRTFANDEGLPHSRVAGTPGPTHHLQVLRARDGANALQGQQSTASKAQQPGAYCCILGTLGTLENQGPAGPPFRASREQRKCSQPLVPTSLLHAAHAPGAGCAVLRGAQAG